MRAAFSILVLTACGSGVTPPRLEPGKLILSGAVTAVYPIPTPIDFTSGPDCYGDLIDVPEAGIFIMIAGLNFSGTASGTYTDANVSPSSVLRCYGPSGEGKWAVQPGQYGSFTLDISATTPLGGTDCTTYEVHGTLHATCPPSQLGIGTPGQGTVVLDAEF
jgi:hypothetical protein